MFKSLLVILIVFLTFTLRSQSATSVPITTTTNTKASTSLTHLKIYPNPASHFIKLKEVTGVSSIIVYNLVGRKIKQFQAEKGKAYSITDLPKGMYLIQFLGLKGKVLNTQRLSKR